MGDRLAPKQVIDMCRNTHVRISVKLIARFAPSCSPRSVQADHAFRSIVIIA
jgi:hypothetical protein